MKHAHKLGEANEHNMRRVGACCFCGSLVGLGMSHYVVFEFCKTFCEIANCLAFGGGLSKLHTRLPHRTKLIEMVLLDTLALEKR